MKLSQGTRLAAAPGAPLVCTPPLPPKTVIHPPAFRWPRLGAMELFILATAGLAVLILVLALHRVALYSDVLLGS
jgi:hypothetical protein